MTRLWPLKRHNASLSCSWLNNARGVPIVEHLRCKCCQEVVLLQMWKVNDAFVRFCQWWNQPFVLDWYREMPRHHCWNKNTRTHIAMKQFKTVGGDDLNWNSHPLIVQNKRKHTTVQNQWHSSDCFQTWQHKDTQNVPQGKEKGYVPFDVVAKQKRNSFIHRKEQTLSFNIIWRKSGRWCLSGPSSAWMLERICQKPQW